MCITFPNCRYGFLNGADGEELTPKPTPIDVLRRRETKWLDMLSDWDGYMLKHYKKVRYEVHVIYIYSFIQYMIIDQIRIRLVTIINTRLRT